jgi:protein involved in polysaccharide export with SLBB domain
MRQRARFLLWALVFPLIMACGPGGKGTGVQTTSFPELKPPPPGPVVVEPYRIQKGDAMNVFFPLNPELNLNNVSVRPDGRIMVNLAGEVNVYGLSVAEASRAISQKYQDFINQTKFSKVLKSGDYFDLRFVYNPELNIGVRIRSDGKISLPIVGEVQAAELTPEDLRLVLIKRYSRDLNKPDIALLCGSQPLMQGDTAAKKLHVEPNFINIALTKLANQYIFVGGEVLQPKNVAFEGHMTVLQAIAAAGGKTDRSDLSRVVIVRRGQFEQSEWIITDLASPVAGKDIKNDIALKAGDVVLVPLTTIAKLNLFVKQWFRDLTPIPGGYSINVGGGTAYNTAF